MPRALPRGARSRALLRGARPRALPRGARPRALLRRTTLAAALGVLGCATLASEAGDDDAVRPNAMAGPFRELRDGELADDSGPAPYILRDESHRWREPAVIALEAEGPEAAALYAVRDYGPVPAVFRFTAADGRSFHLPAGEPLLVPERAWEGSVVANPDVRRVGDELWMLYEAEGGIGLARSTDGLVFDRLDQPVLGPDPNAPWENGEAPGSPGFVALAPDDFRLLYEANGRIGEARSSDGLSWTRLGAPVLEPVGGGEAFDAVAVGDPYALVAESPEGRRITRVYYTGTAGDGSSGLGLAARFGSTGVLRRASSPVLTGSRRPRTPVVVPHQGYTLLFFTERAGSPASADQYAAVAVGVAPATISLPATSARPAQRLRRHRHRRAFTPAPAPPSVYARTGSCTVGAVLLLALFFIAPVVFFYFLVIKGMDRYEPEPLWLLCGMFLWGAVVATLTAIIGNEIGAGALSWALQAGAGDPLVRASTASFVAPPVEETTKGLGLLVLWFFSAVWLRELDGALDGAIYGGVIGLGFTLTEDMLYVAQAGAKGGAAGFTVLFFMRTVMAGLSHASFTAMTGIGVGIAAESKSTLLKLVAPVGGWCAAVGLHFLHNFLVTFMLGQGEGLVLKFLVFWTFDLVFFIVIILLAVRDRAIVLRGLVDEVGRMLHPKELSRTASYWMLMPTWNFFSLMGSNGGYFASRKKQLDLVELAFLKQRRARGGDEHYLNREEARLRSRIQDANNRGVFVGAR